MELIGTDRVGRWMTDYGVGDPTTKRWWREMQGSPAGPIRKRGRDVRMLYSQEGTEAAESVGSSVK